ncbi:MAG: DUF3662 and FHA domain-containing protein [Acidimicrobiia bacterium]
MGLQNFERRLERLVEGAFSRTFASQIQPIEIGRSVIRRLETQRTITTEGTSIPNKIVVHLAKEDVERLGTIVNNLADELCALVRDHANGENYRLVGPIDITIVIDKSVETGQLKIQTAFDQGRGANKGMLVSKNGTRYTLKNDVTTLGRLTTCDVALSDPQCSRVHAEILKTAEGYELVDKGSTNGTKVNGKKIERHNLVLGDEIQFGNSIFIFQADDQVNSDQTSAQ